MGGKLVSDQMVSIDLSLIEDFSLCLGIQLNPDPTTRHINILE